ncbi:DNA-binding response regulator [Floricoccus penangensis]|uniref:DNA-binding response regulator n=1 Tax=Floricoccus penangensis TaxID=1859475 RepID=A0A9Q5JF19_9LACT|nr:response regulator transcription factor [Floricoccus penangensis]OFI45747.1 DNA-binding response regulator [Floricoccus penangensis]
MEKKSILVIEDDQEINLLLKSILEQENYQVTSAYSGSEGILRIENSDYNLILLDLMLPGMTGEELLEKIRANGNQTPVMVISAKQDIAEKVKVLRLGADDYITKPFNSEEVLGRVEVQLRHGASISPKGKKLIHWRDLQMDTEKREASLQGKTLSLTNAEFDILTLFMRQPEHAFSKKEIYENVWDGPYYGDDNTVSVHVSNLRKKLGQINSDEYIKTVWGVGFIMV